MLWVDAEGLVFMRFVNNHKDFIIEEQENKVYYKITIGIDFGGNGSQTTFCAAGIKGHYKELNILKEYQIPLSTNIDADIICNEFLKFYREIEEEYGRVDHVFCDSASPTLINSLRTTAKKNDIRHGNIVGVKKNEVKERPPAIDLLMSQQRFFINEDCKQTIKSLGALKWDEKNPEIPEDKNIGNINDIFDAMCYTFIEFLPYFIRN